MFVRRKPNKSGKINVQVIEKVRGKYKVAKTIGNSSIESEIEKLVMIGEEWIRNYKDSLEFPFNEEERVADSVLDNVESITVSGTELLLDRIFNDIGFNEIKVRPVFHYKQRRIEANISIAFVAYKVYKELERQLLEKGSKLSPQKEIEIAKGIYTVEIQLKSSSKKIRKTLLLNESQQKLAKMFGF